jgi:hypothetical protein
MNEQIKQLHNQLGHHGDQWKVTNANNNDTYEYCEHCGVLLHNNAKIDYLPYLWWFGESTKAAEKVKEAVRYSHNEAGLYACGLNKIEGLMNEKNEVVQDFVRCYSDMIKFDRPLRPTKFPTWLFDRLLEADEMWLALKWKDAGYFDFADENTRVEEPASGV